MKHQDWTDQLRQRMADHEEPLPEGLWTHIEQRMQRRARVVMLRRRAAAAAAVVLLAVGGWQLSDMLTSTTPAKPPVASTNATPTPQDEPLTAQATSPNAQVADMTEPRAGMATQRSTQPVARAAETYTAPTALTSNELAETLPEAPTITDAPTPSATDSMAPATPPHTQLPPAQHQLAAGTTISRQAQRQRVAMSVHATNLMATADYSQSKPLFMTRSAMGPMANYLSSDATFYLSGFEDQTHHKMPVGVGLSLRYSLSHSWWLSTGVDYMLASSTFTHVLPTNIVQTDQHLHYVGVPLAVGYTLWRGTHVTAYASAGAEAQVNVKATVTEGHVDRDRMQLSVLGSAGLELTVWPQLSLYAQPGVRYYPDNGSHVQNIFKERPWQLDVQLGLRYTIK